MTPSGVFAFGPFEFDSRSGELRKHGLRVRLPDQARAVLELLLARPGDVVTREDIRQRLWPADTFVEFDTATSSIVRKLRDALGDSADQPRFVETLPRRGYRFIAPVLVGAEAAAAAHAAAPALPAAGTPASPSRSRSWTGPAWISVTVAIGLLGAAAVLARTAARPRVSPEANDAYMKGVAARGRESVPGFRAAVTYFEEAAAKQPDFAMAYAQIADAQLQLVYAGEFAPREIVPRADAAVQRALALDETIAFAHRTRAEILQTYYWEWDAGNREIRRSLELDRTSSDARAYAASMALTDGRVNEAIAEAEEAHARDPLSPRAALTLAGILRASGQVDRSLDELRTLVARDPRIARAHFQIGVTYALKEQWPQAVDALQEALEITPANARFQSYLGFALAKAGRLAEARAVLDQLRARAQLQYVSGFGLALLHDALGEGDAALAALTRAYDEHAVEFSQWRQYPGFKALQTEPRYQAIFRRVVRQQ